MRRRIMKLCTNYLFKLITIIAISFILVGCTYTVKSVDLLPQMQAGSPLKSLSPRTFAFKEFRDTRGVTDPLLLLKAGAELKLDQPPAIIVATAIKRELERNGHRCIDYSPQSKADFIVEGTVYKYWYGFYTGFFTNTHTVNAGVKLTVGPVSDDKRVLTKNYEGEYVLSDGRHPRVVGKDALSQALLAMIKEISTDSELIEFIEK
jgi:hypothetical protein